MPAASAESLARPVGSVTIALRPAARGRLDDCRRPAPCVGAGMGGFLLVRVFFPRNCRTLFAGSFVRGDAVESFRRGAFLGSRRRDPRGSVLLGSVSILDVDGCFRRPGQLSTVPALSCAFVDILGRLDAAAGPLQYAGAPVRLMALVILLVAGLAVVLGHLDAATGLLPHAGAPVRLAALGVLLMLLPLRATSAGGPSFPVVRPIGHSVSSAPSSPSSIVDSTDVRSMMRGVKLRAPADSDDDGANVGASGRRADLRGGK